MTKLTLLFRALLLGVLVSELPGLSCWLPTATAQASIPNPNKVDTAVEQTPTRQMAAQRAEAQTRQRGVAQRLPGEADSTFLRRVLPVAYAQSQDLLAYAWRPSAFGKQLFFSVHGEEGNEYGTNLFVLDPYQENTYAVQVLPIAQADDTYLDAIFFADANHDGRKDLLALSSWSLREPVKIDDQWMHGRTMHYHTDTWHYLGLDKAGRPQYQQGPERPDLNDLATAAEVRQSLALPLLSRPRHPASAKAVRSTKVTK